MARHHLTNQGRKAALLLCGALMLGACAPQYANHGYIPPQEELAQVRPGIDTRASVVETLGPSATGSVAGDSDVYYIRSRVRSFGMFEPEVVEREVVAISFNANGTVSTVERFGLERGQEVPLARDVTDTDADNRSFLRQLLGNVGRIGPG